MTTFKNGIGRYHWIVTLSHCVYVEVESMAWLKIVIAMISFCFSAFCFLESALCASLTYTAFRRGPLRGVSYQAFAREDAMFLAAALVSFWVAVKIRPKQFGRPLQQS